MRAMRYLLLALALVSCTKIHRTEIAAVPPSLAELHGSFQVEWNGASLFSAAAIAEDGSLVFQTYPCRPPGALDSIGGTFIYNPDTGQLVAEIKSLDGVAKITLDVRFTSKDDARGGYEVLIFAGACNSGALVLSRAL